MPNNPYFCRMLKYTKHTLKKIETFFNEIAYTIRYEKGNFNSGYCIVENRKMAVINKFFDTEGRINCLLEIFQQLEEVPLENLSEASAKLYKQMQKMASGEAVEEEEEQDMTEIAETDSSAEK